MEYSIVTHDNGTLGEYQKRFDEIAEGQIISSRRTKTTEFFTFSRNNTEWKMAYDNSSLARSQLPPYWFVDRQGNVISVRYKHPLYVYKDTNNKRGYIKYHFTVKGNKKCISGHALTALVFGAPVMPDAKIILDEKGLYAYGTRNNDLQTHHQDAGNILDCDPAKQTIMLGGDHRLLHAQRWCELVQSMQAKADMTGHAFFIVPPYDVDNEGDQIRYNGTFVMQETSQEDTDDLMRWILGNTEFIPLKINLNSINALSGLEKVESVTVEVH